MEFKTTEEKVCYGFGRQMGRQIYHEQFDGYSMEAFLEGVKDALLGNPLQIDKDELNQAFSAFQEEMDKKNREKNAGAIEAAEKFMEENKKREGVVITASGLQYEVMKEGDGDVPGPKDVVRVHYHGTLPDGSVFDSSVERNEPAEFPVNGVIAGWIEALQLMKEGSKYRLAIPYNLAYGERGVSSIPPYSPLVFEVELIKIVMRSKE